jgi:hypothetical protein
MTDPPTSDDLRAVEREEETKEHEAVRPEEAKAAARRADKAGYLAGKVAEQEDSR